MKRLLLWAAIAGVFLSAQPTYALSLRPAVIDVEATPGERVHRRLEIRNDRAVPMTIYATVQGVLPKSDGSGVDFLDPGTAEATKWIRSSQKEWVLGAGEVRTIDLFLDVPSSTRSGFYPMSVAFSEFYRAENVVSQAVRIASLWFINVKNKETSVEAGRVGEVQIVETRFTREKKNLWLEVVVDNKTDHARRLTGTIKIKRNGEEETQSVDALNVRVLPKSERVLRFSAGSKSWGRYVATIQIDGVQQEEIKKWIIPWRTIGTLGIVVIGVVSAGYFFWRKKMRR